MEEENKKLKELFEYMVKQFIALIDSNNNLLNMNLKLIKENNELRKFKKD